MKKSPIYPPRLANRLLGYFLRDELLEEVTGDLEENFFKVAKTRSALRAKANYWYQVLNYVRPFAVRKSTKYFNDMSMFQNYCKVGWRNMLDQKTFSAIKVFGFALGIAACLLIALFIRHELSFDKHYLKQSRIFRVVESYNDKGTIHRGWSMPAPFATALKDDYAEIELVGRLNPVELFGAGNNDIRPESAVENVHEEGFVYADNEIFEILEIPFVYGNPKTALTEPNTIVLTRSKAQKYFGRENPIGKLMVIRNDTQNPVKVTGVIEDHRPNSHFQFQFLQNLQGRVFYPGESTNWMASNYMTYIRVGDNADPVALERKLKQIGEKYYLPRLLEQNRANAKEDVANLSYELQPVADIHMNRAEIRDRFIHGDERFTWMSAAVCVFILLLACINFINLSTAKSANRAKEVGMRKVVGSARANLVKQFMVESLLYCLFSFIVGIAIALVAFPYFSDLVARQLTFPWNEWWLLPTILGAVLVIGVLAGLYPSLYLSSFKPIQVLKGSVARGSKSATTRSMLVVFQFTTSIFLIIGTFVVYRQMQFVLNTKIGYDKGQVMLIQGTNILGDKIDAFRNELTSVRDVKAASVTDYLPIRGGSKRNGNSFSNPQTPDLEVPGQFWIVDEHYLNTYGMKLVTGRNLQTEGRADSLSAIINQSMVTKLGLKDPIGAQIKNYRRIWTVVGVVEDFHYESMREPLQPLMMVLGKSPFVVSVKINTADMPAAIAAISETWRKFAPQQPIRYTFLDESYQRMYHDVQRMGKIFTGFSILAIIVACLGLFGLSSFMVEQRAKEISIRLVLGASVRSIFSLLTNNFVVLVAISFVIASPLAWLIMKRWLESFVYRTDIAADIFIISGGAALLIALSTISYQAVRAGMTNPVNKLRSE